MALVGVTHPQQGRLHVLHNRERGIEYLNETFPMLLSSPNHTFAVASAAPMLLIPGLTPQHTCRSSNAWFRTSLMCTK